MRDTQAPGVEAKGHKHRRGQPVKNAAPARRPHGPMRCAPGMRKRPRRRFRRGGPAGKRETRDAAKPRLRMVCRFPGVPRVVPRGTGPVTSRRLLRRRRLGLWRPTSRCHCPLAGAAAGRPTYHGPRPRTRLVLGGPSVVWGCPRRLVREPARRSTLRRTARPGAVAKPGHRRGRRLLPREPRDPVRREASRGRGRVRARNHKLGILSRFFVRRSDPDRDDRRLRRHRAAGPRRRGAPGL